MASVRPISSDEHLAFIDAQPSASFLQTPAWATVKNEWRAESLGLWVDDTLAGVALVLHRPIPRFPRRTLAYIPEGPVLCEPLTWDDTHAWIPDLAEYLGAGGAFALRFGPPVATATWDTETVKAGLADASVGRLTELTPSTRSTIGEELTAELLHHGWRLQSPEDGFGSGQPQYTFEVPLRDETGTALSEEQLLAGMNQLWRRNIKKAEKEGVTVDVVTRDFESLDALAEFHRLYVETAARDHFTPRPLSYFVRMMNAMSAEEPERITLFIARHEGEAVAATIYVRVGTHAWYLYGASSTAKREVRGSNAVQWAMMRAALAQSCTVYDLRGITPTLDADDSHAGLIQFKVGTGGHAVGYVGEWDLALRPLIYRAFDAYTKLRGRK